MGGAALFSKDLAIKSMRLIARHVSTEQIVVLLGQTEGVGRGAVDVVCILLSYALSIGTSRSFLSGAWSQTVVIIVVLARTKTSLASLVALGSALTLTTASHGLSTAHDVAGGLDCVVLLHLVVKGCGSAWTAALEDTKLLLVQDLGVCKALVCIGLAEVRGAHNLLRHH